MRVADRSEGNQTRRERLAKIKKGPGVFVYNGSMMDTAYEPTVLKAGRMVPKLDDQGMPILDATGRQIFESHGQIVRDAKGTPLLGGPPVRKTKNLDTINVWGVEFPKGKPVQVDSHALALKLRCMACMDEVDAMSADPFDGEGMTEEVVIKPKKTKKAKD